jgi:hypothetical protein
MTTIVQKLVEARKLFRPFGKNRQAYNYKYADLDEIVSATTEGLQSQGLSVHTTTEAIEIAQKPWLIVTAFLSDASGEKLSASIPMPLDSVGRAKVPAQDMGSIVTYGRRYAYAALLNLTADEDIDAAPEDRKPEQRPAAANVKAPVPAVKADDPKIKADQLALIRNYVAAHGPETVTKLLNIQSTAVINSWNLATLKDATKFLSENLPVIK